MPSRAKTAALFCGLLLGLWYGMQVVHEAGHALAAWATGGHVERVVLWPWTISRTDVSPNPQPLVVVWGGPILGIAIPLFAWGVLAYCRWQWAHVARFFAGFCLVANGLYLGIGSIDGIGDAGEILQLGVPPWGLWLFGGIAAPCGLALWHGQGRQFGLAKREADPRKGS